jgi:hypothetical protein
MTASRLPVPPPAGRVPAERPDAAEPVLPGASPVLPPASPYAHTGRLDHAMRTESPLPWSGVAVDMWCHARFDADRLASLVDDFRAAAAGAARLDGVHHTHWPLVRQLIETTEALCLPGIALRGDIAIEASRLLDYRAGQRAAMPCHQDGTGPGLLLDPRHALTATYLLAHDGNAPWARVSTASLADGYLPHQLVQAGVFGDLPRAVRGDRRWECTDIDLQPGQVLCLDTRTLRSIGTDASWTALSLRLVTPLGIVRRPADAPPPRAARPGGNTRWHDPAALHRARRKFLGPGHDAGADELLAATEPATSPTLTEEDPRP